MDSIAAGVDSLGFDNVIALGATGHYIITHLSHCMYLCIVRLKFTATLIYKRVALYNFQNKVLAVRLENYCHVFEGQRNFETDCIRKLARSGTY